jgi:DNA-binding winged helix-turn-helix (wHTH) protein
MMPDLGAVQATGSPGVGQVMSRIVITGNDPEIGSVIGRALAAAGYVTDFSDGWAERLQCVSQCHDELIVAGRLAADLDGPLIRGQPGIWEEAHLHHEVIRVGQLRLDLGRLTASTGTGPVLLTRLEFLLLRELAEHAGQPVPKSNLLAAVWGYEFDPGSNVVDVCVRRLRSKLGFDLIKTVRGGGYQLAGHLPRSAARLSLVEPRSAP